ncbi:hypothetical protein T08_2542 [Trichinella sp. T8]|nr:hypothetical protein T08_2542 [Trichinella sp. T8]
MPNGGSTQTPPLGIRPGKHLHIPPKHIDPPTHSVNGLQNWPVAILTIRINFNKPAQIDLERKHHYNAQNHLDKTLFTTLTTIKNQIKYKNSNV